MQRILPPFRFLLAAGLAVGVGIAAPILDLVPGWWRLVAVPVGAAGLALNVSSAQRFGRIGTNIRTFDDPDLLVSDGAFAFTRNPMYLGFVTMLVAVAVAVGSLSAWVGPIAFFLDANHNYVPFEERRMAATFGASYDEYCARVRRWLGRRGGAPAPTARAERRTGQTESHG